MLPNERLESFWDALWLGIRTFLCFKMSNWSHFGVNFHENNGRQWPESEKWTPKAAYRRRMALVMHIISPCVRPKRAHKQQILIFPMNFEGSREPGGFYRCQGKIEQWHFGVIRGSLLDTLWLLLSDLGYMRVTLESLWSNFKKQSFS